MNWPTDEFLVLVLSIADIEFSKSTSTNYPTSGRLIEWPDHDLESQEQSNYLSMDEVRASLDGFEQICQHANLSVDTMLHNRPSVGWAMA
jgi:hypothetical protein